VGGWGGARGGGSRGQKNRRLQRGGRPGPRVEARKKKKAGKGWEAAEGWEAGGESRGQKKKEAGKGWEAGGCE